MITGMGLALGIDYALFVLSRFREERRKGHDKLAAIELAGASASRAVLFCGTTFVVAMFGMLLVRTSIMRSLRRRRDHRRHRVGGRRADAAAGTARGPR